MVAAQSSGCAPVVRGFQNLSSSTDFWKDSNTIALGLNVPGPIGGHWILDILYQREFEWLEANIYAQHSGKERGTISDSDGGNMGCQPKI